MMGWTVAAVATTIFLSLYESEDFRERMNMKISPDMTYRYKLIAIMFVDFAFCYIWEVSTIKVNVYESFGELSHCRFLLPHNTQKNFT